MLPTMRLMISLIVLAGLAMSIALPASAADLDRRRMLNAAEHVPWRAVGRVNIGTMRSVSMCTGTLIGEDLVLTAAHCVINPQTGGVYRPGQVTFVAGWRLGTKVASSKAARITVHPDYQLNDQQNLRRIGSDLALIQLADPIARDKAPYFGIAPAPGQNSPLVLISYRQDRPNALTRQTGCKILGAQDAVLGMECNVTFGASGSPVFMSVGGEMRLVAVISSMGQDARQSVAYAVLVEAALPEVLAAQE